MTTDDHIQWIGPPDDPTAARFRIRGMKMPGVTVNGGVFERLWLAVRIVLRRPVRLETGSCVIEVLTAKETR